jgi:hypothetical protein
VCVIKIPVTGLMKGNFYSTKCIKLFNPIVCKNKTFRLILLDRCFLEIYSVKDTQVMNFYKVVLLSRKSKCVVCLIAVFTEFLKLHGNICHDKSKNKYMSNVYSLGTLGINNMQTVHCIDFA